MRSPLFDLNFMSAHSQTSTIQQTEFTKYANEKENYILVIDLGHIIESDCGRDFIEV